jgi:DNA-binding GntR family transcriptional regulator
MMRTYGIARGALRKLQARMSEEGWAEQNVGHGWSFLPLIDSLEAYEESYLFRQAIEPVGILAATFSFDQPEWSAIREEQLRIVNGGYKTMTPIELFEAARRFHETIARWSGNRFIAQSVRRINQQRRLVEYHQAVKRKPRQTHAQEHVLILDAIGNQNFVHAAALMRSHLDAARRNKSLSFS